MTPGACACAQGRRGARRHTRTRLFLVNRVSSHAARRAMRAAPRLGPNRARAVAGAQQVGASSPPAGRAQREAVGEGPI